MPAGSGVQGPRKRAEGHAVPSPRSSELMNPVVRGARQPNTADGRWWAPAQGPQVWAIAAGRLRLRDGPAHLRLDGSRVAGPGSRRDRIRCEGERSPPAPLVRRDNPTLRYGAPQRPERGLSEPRARRIGAPTGHSVARRRPDFPPSAPVALLTDGGPARELLIPCRHCFTGPRDSDGHDFLQARAPGFRVVRFD